MVNIFARDLVQIRLSMPLFLVARVRFYCGRWCWKIMGDPSSHATVVGSYLGRVRPDGVKEGLTAYGGFG